MSGNYYRILCRFKRYYFDLDRGVNWGWGYHSHFRADHFQNFELRPDNIEYSFKLLGNKRGK